MKPKAKASPREGTHSIEAKPSSGLSRCSCRTTCVCVWEWECVRVCVGKVVQPLKVSDCGCGWMCAAVEMHPNKHKIYMNTWASGLKDCTRLPRPSSIGFWFPTLPHPLRFHLHPLFIESLHACGNKSNFVVLLIKTGLLDFNLPSGRCSFVHCQTHNCTGYVLYWVYPVQIWKYKKWAKSLA